MAGFEMLLELPVELLEHVVQAAVEKAWSAVQTCSRGGAVQPCSLAAVQPWNRAAVEPWSRGAVELCSLAALQSCSRAAVQPWSAEELSSAAVQPCGRAVQPWGAVELRYAAVRPWSPEEDEELSVAGRLGLTVAELWVARCVQPCSLVEQTRRMLGWRALPRPPEGRRCVAW